MQYVRHHYLLTLATLFLTVTAMIAEETNNEPIRIYSRISFDEEVINSELPVAIKVYADWCGPCQRMTPIFHELAQELSSSIKFIEINVDAARPLANELGVMSIPTFLFYSDGDLVKRRNGTMSKAQLQQELEDLVT